MRRALIERIKSTGVPVIHFGTGRQWPAVCNGRDEVALTRQLGIN
jgi:hypothetical protein